MLYRISLAFNVGLPDAYRQPPLRAVFAIADGPLWVGFGHRPLATICQLQIFTICIIKNV